MKLLWKKYFIAFLLLLVLILVRFYEKMLFDDGLIYFFEHDYLTEFLPQISLTRIIVIDAFRYWFNAFISMSILFVLFKQKNLLRFLLWFYLALFVVALLLLTYYLVNYEQGQYLGVFYSRRILIQPLALLILVPALIYQKKEADQ